MRALAKPVAPDASRRPRILHVDDDNVVARALSEIADVVTVNSIEEAQRALKAADFDLAVLDVAARQGGQLTICCPSCATARAMQFRWSFFPPRAASLASEAQAKAALAKSHSSIDSLVATVRDRLASRRTSPSMEVV